MEAAAAEAVSAAPTETAAREQQTALLWDYVLGEGDEKMARLFINIGKAQRITPGDILGAVAGESGIPGRMVGSIDMYDGYTFVDVPGCYADDVLKAMAHAKIKERIFTWKKPILTEDKSGSYRPV